MKDIKITLSDGMTITKKKDGHYKISYKGYIIDNISTAQELQTVKLFVLGIKPAMMLWGKVKLNKKFANKFFIHKGYFPHYDVESLDEETREILSYYMIFHEERRYNYFLKYGHKDPKNFNHGVIGNLLGFPPAAVHTFLNPNHNHWVTIDYHGIFFGCEKSAVKKCLRWLKKKYSIPMEVQTNIQVVFE